MPRKKLNDDQKLIVYCLTTRLRDPNYNSGIGGFDFVFQEAKEAVRLYIETSGLGEKYRNEARKKFDGITLEETNDGKAEGIINTFRQSAKGDAKELYDFIKELILPEKLEDHNMEFWGNQSRNKRVRSYFVETISSLNYKEGAYGKAKKDLYKGRESELIPCGRISQDLLSKFDTLIKRIGRKLQYDDSLLDWITNRVKIESPYNYREVKPNIKSIALALKEDLKSQESTNMKIGYLVSEAISKYELANKPEYILDPNSYRDNLQKTFKSYF